MSEFAFREPVEEEKALLRQRLATEQFVTQKAEVEAKKAATEYEEFRAMVDLTRASNFRNRVYDFVSAVREESVEDALQAVGRWHRQDPGAPITIRFTSPGGDVMAGLSFFDSLRMYISDGTPITTIATGQAASMAAVLLQAGTKRIVAPKAYFLIHEVTETGIKLVLKEDVFEKEKQVAFMKSLNDTLFGILAERATISRSEIAKKAKRNDWWLGADDCIKYGFADEILKTSYKPKG